MRALFSVRRAGVILMLAVLGCGTKVTEVTGPPDFTVSLLPSAPSVPAAGSVVLVATVVRKGGFSAAVDFVLTGEFPGMTSVVSDIQTTGDRTTALITISVASGVQLSPHELKLHVAGNGVEEKVLTFNLTVTVSEQPGFGLFFFNPDITIAQGASTVIPVSVFRNHYTGPVSLSVDNLPTGVTIAFNPASPLVPPLGEATNLTLNVASNAPPGVFANVRLHAVADPASHLSDSFVPITLTITPTP